MEDRTGRVQERKIQLLMQCHSQSKNPDIDLDI